MPDCTSGRIRTRCSTSRSLQSRRRRAQSSQDATARACCHSERRSPSAWTYSLTIGPSRKRWQNGTAKLPIVRSGDWSASCISPRPKRRRVATWSTAWSSGSAISRMSPLSRKWRSKAATSNEMIDFVNGGLGVVGTPDMAIAQIEELLEQSNGGFGAYLTLAHNWANPESTKKSYELMARHVMPEVPGSGRFVDRRRRPGTFISTRPRRQAAHRDRRGHRPVRGGEGIDHPLLRSYVFCGPAITSTSPDRSRRRESPSSAGSIGAPSRKTSSRNAIANVLVNG